MNRIYSLIKYFSMLPAACYEIASFCGSSVKCSLELIFGSLVFAIVFGYSRCSLAASVNQSSVFHITFLCHIYLLLLTLSLNFVLVQQPNLSNTSKLNVAHFWLRYSRIMIASRIYLFSLRARIVGNTTQSMYLLMNCCLVQMAHCCPAPLITYSGFG